MSACEGASGLVFQVLSNRIGGWSSLYIQRVRERDLSVVCGDCLWGGEGNAGKGITGTSARAGRVGMGSGWACWHVVATRGVIDAIVEA